MKKKMIIYIVIIVIEILAVINISKQQSQELKAFNLADYEWAIDQYSFNGNIGSIKDAEDAEKRVKEFWKERYHDLDEESGYIPLYRKAKVYFDQKNECWLVYGTLPRDYLGFVPNIIVKGNGDIVAVWLG